MIIGISEMVGMSGISGMFSICLEFQECQYRNQVLHISESQPQTDFNDENFVEDIRKVLFQKGKFEYNKNLLDKINKKNFNDNEFKKIANADQSKIQDLTFNSVRDNKTFSIDSVKIIYSLPINSYTLIADDNDNIYIAKIIKEDFIEVSKTDKILDLYREQSSKNIKENLYSSYDIFLNSKYNIKINEKTIERVKNYFK